MSVVVDQLASAMGLETSSASSQADMRRSGQTPEEWILGRALETIIEQQRALGELPKIVAAARRHGWDGVNNSKVLSTFLGDRLTQADGMDRVRGAISSSKPRANVPPRPMHLARKRRTSSGPQRRPSPCCVNKPTFNPTPCNCPPE